KKMFKWLKKDGTAFLVLGNQAVKDRTENFHGVQMYWSHFGKEGYREITDKVGFKLVWDDVETLPNGEVFYNVILKKCSDVIS
ncbi:MAG TPA: hypothetical protein VNI60_04400, partial [Pyrinomonadaceae bacterium]|nr:hypothetical protein [Pyrinomonadaceae bacterium]